jgi:hypothetical protein
MAGELQQESVVIDCCDTSVVTTASLQTTKRSNRSKSTMNKYNTIREYMDFLSNSGVSNDAITEMFRQPTVSLSFFRAFVVDDGIVRTPEAIAQLVQDALTARHISQPPLPTASIHAPFVSNDGADTESSVGSNGATCSSATQSTTQP